MVRIDKVRQAFFLKKGNIQGFSILPLLVIILIDI